ncbi:MAG TPA: hypothetical protein VHV55_25550 [Pirellulales bacterium]|nr:hypothetical protein [Pirellulales bacterium]
MRLGYPKTPIWIAYFCLCLLSLGWFNETFRPPLSIAIGSVVFCHSLGLMWGEQSIGTKRGFILGLAVGLILAALVLIFYDERLSH